MTLKEIQTAIKATRKLGVRPSLQLMRHRDALQYLKSWERSLKLARTKVRHYQKRVRYYEKRLGGGE